MTAALFDTTNALDLVSELDRATEVMMALDVGQVGGDQWKDAFSRQQNAFWAWREYLHRKADEKPPARLLSVG